MRLTTAGIAALAAIALSIAPAYVGAEQAGKKATHAAGRHAGATNAPSDTDFVRKAAETGLAEVQTGDLAKQRAENAEVKEFADRMVRDHTQANEGLAQIAKKDGIPLPQDVEEKHKKEMDRLSKLSGAAFDRAYMKAQVAGHHETVALLEREAKSGKDPDLKSWAEKTLATVQDHTKSAEQIAKQIGASGATAKHAGGMHHTAQK